MKLFPYPQPRIALHRRETSSGRPESYWNHSTMVIRWMGRNALRRIHEFDLAAQAWPTVDELEAWIVSTHQKALSHCDDADYAAKALDAAVFALSAYDPKVWEAFSQRGANGGRKSRGKRPPVHKPEHLDGLEEMSKTEQAARLGCSVATIGRLRAERARMQQEPDFLDSVMADIDAEGYAIAPVAAKQSEPAAIAPVAASKEWQNPVVSIATGKPIDYLGQVLLDYQTEYDQRAAAAASEFLDIIAS